MSALAPEKPLLGAARGRAELFAAEIWNWRANAQLSANSAAHCLGVTLVSYNAIEAGHCDPAEMAPSTALRIQRQASVSPALFSIEGAQTEPTPINVGLARDCRVTVTSGLVRWLLQPDEARLLAASLIRHADLAEA